MTAIDLCSKEVAQIITKFASKESSREEDREAARALAVTMEAAPFLRLSASMADCPGQTEILQSMEAAFIAGFCAGIRHAAENAFEKMVPRWP